MKQTCMADTYECQFKSQLRDIKAIEIYNGLEIRDDGCLNGVRIDNGDIMGFLR